jgi:hypothetical protein
MNQDIIGYIKGLSQKQKKEKTMTNEQKVQQTQTKQYGS